jgi:hypothetical protein
MPALKMNQTDEISHMKKQKPAAKKHHLAVVKSVVTVAMMPQTVRIREQTQMGMRSEIPNNCKSKMPKAWLNMMGHVMSQLHIRDNGIICPSPMRIMPYPPALQEYRIASTMGKYTASHVTFGARVIMKSAWQVLTTAQSPMMSLSFAVEPSPLATQSVAGTTG